MNIGSLVIKRRLRVGVVGILSLSLLFTLLIITNLNDSSIVIADTGKATTAIAGNGYLLRFDSAMNEFEIIPLPPIAGVSRTPHSVAVFNNDIWYTDPAANRVGRLTYTDTNTYTFEEIDTLPAGSSPYDIVAGSNYLWFTAQDGNWIGRIDPLIFPSPSSYSSFNISTADSRPGSIIIDTQGSIWFTQERVAQLGQLIVTDTIDFSLIEIPVPEVDAELKGIEVLSDSQGDHIVFADIKSRLNTIFVPGVGNVVTFTHRLAMYNLNDSSLIVWYSCHCQVTLTT